MRQHYWTEVQTEVQRLSVIIIHVMISPKTSILTNSKKMSSHLQAVPAVREPTKGAWNVWLNDVVVMSTEAGLMKRKGIHSHWGGREIPDHDILREQ